MKFYKYHGAGNDFIIGDNREGSIHLNTEEIINLCDRHYGIGSDGIILLENSSIADFKMVFYNPDGSAEMMCGNGGRCICFFAKKLGIPHNSFEAADGIHQCAILNEDFDSKVAQVRISMNPVTQVEFLDELSHQISQDFPLLSSPCFLNTGTYHLCILAEKIKNIDIAKYGAKYRHHPHFAPKGTNVNFIEQRGEYELFMRTFEKGVEAETWACGTGAIAAAIYMFREGNRAINAKIHTQRETLTVEFISSSSGASDIYLSGPATLVAEINI